jgi:hypothetical protein
MSRFLIASTAFPAHLDYGGLLSTAVRLRSIGHEVMWATGASVAPMIEQHGIDVTPVANIDPTHGVDVVEPAAVDDRAHWTSIWRTAFRGVSRCLYLATVAERGARRGKLSFHSSCNP